jgi:hypothetical protein
MFITFLIESFIFGLVCLIWYWFIIQLNIILLFFEKRGQEESENVNLQSFDKKNILNTHSYKFIFIQGTIVGSLLITVLKPLLKPLIPKNFDFTEYGVFNEVFFTLGLYSLLEAIIFILIACSAFYQLLIVVIFPIWIFANGIVILGLKIKKYYTKQT